LPGSGDNAHKPCAFLSLQTPEGCVAIAKTALSPDLGIDCLMKLPDTLPQELLHGDYAGNYVFHAAFQQWVQQSWQEKDLQIQLLLKRPRDERTTVFDYCIEVVIND
jgi:hypothetical protein